MTKSERKIYKLERLLRKTLFKEYTSNNLFVVIDNYIIHLECEYVEINGRYGIENPTEDKDAHSFQNSFVFTFDIGDKNSFIQGKFYQKVQEIEGVDKDELS